MKVNVNKSNAIKRGIKSYSNDQDKSVTISTEFWVTFASDFERLFELFVGGMVGVRSDATNF